MAILTVSRQIASLGDELCMSIADKLGYKFISRKIIEKKILELGFDKAKLKKFDEKKPGFLTSLTSDRDEYLDYLQTAIFECACEDNVVIIGRGAFILLKSLPNHIALRFIADRDLRVSRYQAEHKCSARQAEKIINESDLNRDGFNKGFFNFDMNDPAMFHLVINTGLLDKDTITGFVKTLVKESVTAEKTEEGKKILKQQLFAQKILTLLRREHGIEIRFPRVEINDDKKITVYGMAESESQIEKIIRIMKNAFSGYEICSRLSV